MYLIFLDLISEKRKTRKMNLCGLIVTLLGLISQVRSIALTLDENAQQLCKKYKMMCKAHEVCAVQHFTEPKMTMPVCIPLSFVPAEYKHHVRNLVCKLPPEKGTCYARYTRWHYNIHHQGCTHFQYGGCGGNQNNFMTREECENTCLRTPSIRLIDGGSIKPAIMTAPEYKPPQVNKYEALNSVMMSSPEYNNYDRYAVMKHRNNRVKPNNETSTRKRRRLEKERAAKERRRRERRKEKRRLKKMKKKQRRKDKKRGLKKKKKSGKRKKKKSDDGVEDINETSMEEKSKDEQIAEHNAEIVEEAEKIVNNEIEALEEEEKIRKEKRKERKRKKRRQRRKKRRLGRSKRHKKTPRYAELRGSGTTMFKMFHILDKEDSGAQDGSLEQTN